MSDFQFSGRDAEEEGPLTLPDRILNWVDRGLIAVSVLSICCMMVLIFLDATLRYTMNKPLRFTVDVVSLYLMSATILLGLSYVLRRGNHIAVDLFIGLVNRRYASAIQGITFLVGSAVTCVMSYELLHSTAESFREGEVMTGIYAWPIWPSKALVAVAFTAITARLLQMGIAGLLAARRGTPDDPKAAQPSHHTTAEGYE